jgi:cytosine/adenosine deaminase-related metal-dependent hydrolase
MTKRHLLHRVRLNDGIYAIAIQDGNIATVEAESAGLEPLPGETAWDADGLLMLPAFRDAHVHLDKAFPNDTWISRKPVSSLYEQFQLEKDLLATCKERREELARRTIERMLAYGTVTARVHVDLDPELGLSHVELLLRLKQEYASRLDMELVAFPQQGLLRSGSAPLIREALTLGVDAVGGVDPGGVDRQVERSLETMFELAESFAADIDLHLHDSGHLGIFTIEKMLDYSRQAGWKGKVTVSHAYGLGEVDEGAITELADRMAEEEMRIVTSVPIDSAMPPVQLLASRGVKVLLGTDHTGLDAWTPYGNADILLRGRLLAEKNRWNDDERMNRVYSWMSAGALKPKVGDRADFILVHAHNAPHALASAPRRMLVCKDGMPVAGRLIGKSSVTAWERVPQRRDWDDYNDL